MPGKPAGRRTTPRQSMMDLSVLSMALAEVGQWEVGRKGDEATVLEDSCPRTYRSTLSKCAITRGAG